MHDESVLQETLKHHSFVFLLQSSLTETTFVSLFMNWRDKYVLALWQREPIAVALYSTYSPEGAVWKRCGPFDYRIRNKPKFQHLLLQSTIQHHKDDADMWGYRSALLRFTTHFYFYYQLLDVRAFLQASFFRKWTHAPYTLFSYI